MENLGLHNDAFGAEKFGFKDLKKVYWNLEAPRLYEEAIRRGEAKLAAHGPIVAETGVHTGR